MNIEASELTESAEKLKQTFRNLAEAITESRKGMHSFILRMGEMKEMEELPYKEPETIEEYKELLRAKNLRINELHRETTKLSSEESKLRKVNTDYRNRIIELETVLKCICILTKKREG